MENNHLVFILVAIITFGLTAGILVKLIPILKRKASQPIYLDGPEWHASKSGTPTMGGLAFLIAITVALLGSVLFLALDGFEKPATSLLLCLGFTILNALIGLIDDLTKIRRKENAGLSPLQKLGLQSISAILLLIGRAYLIGGCEEIVFGFGSVDFGSIYYPLAFIMLIATVNSANLTDGVDGLASSVAFAIATSLMYLSLNTSPEVFLISSATIGATVAFLIFNLHPAKIFMGDTGSLLLGALVSSSAIALGNPLIIIFLGGVYLIEAISVIMQVVVFKVTGKRVFKMAPLHHHLERSGLSEMTICIVAILATFVLSIPAMMMYLS